MNDHNADQSSLEIVRDKREDLEKKAAAYPELERPYSVTYNLDKARQEEAEFAARHESKKNNKIDIGLLTGYNLTFLTEKFKKSFKGLYEGSFAFCMGGDSDIVDQYVIERLHRELKGYTGRPFKEVEIYLSLEDFSKGNELIEYKLKEQNDSDLYSFFGDGSNDDIFMIVWNRELPCEKIEEVAFTTWENFRNKTEVFIKDQYRILIVLWVNAEPGCLKGFTLLDIPAKFDISTLEQWFRGQLIHARLPNEKINKYWKKLENLHGDLFATYRVLRKIIRELQGGTKRYE